VKKILAGETIIDGHTDDCEKDPLTEKLVKEELNKLLKMEEGSKKSTTARCSACGGAGSSRRRIYRRVRKNHEAINFLRRIVLVVVLIELVSINPLITFGFSIFAKYFATFLHCFIIITT